MKKLNRPSFRSRRITNPAGAILDLLRLFFHDLVLVYDRPKESYGAIGISVNDSNIEVAHNRFENCRHAATAYGYDGGAIEIARPTTSPH